MSGFSYKNFVLQIIHGGILTLTIVFLIIDTPKEVLAFLKNHESTAILSFLLVSFIFGVIIDFLSDVTESFLMKYLSTPPIYYLLVKDNWRGISLAHRKSILNQLLTIMKKSDYSVTEIKQYEGCFVSSTKSKQKRKELTHIFQVAKNKAFKICSVSQKEQIDSFFILYIFSRNISLSFIVLTIVLCFRGYFIESFLILAILTISLAASYRYYLYYVRIILGSIFINEDPKKRLRLNDC